MNRDLGFGDENEKQYLVYFIVLEERWVALLSQ
jgi:hypothetical protein